jgi:hypothetical protein
MAKAFAVSNGGCERDAGTSSVFMLAADAANEMGVPTVDALAPPFPPAPQPVSTTSALIAANKVCIRTKVRVRTVFPIENVIEEVPKLMFIRDNWPSR